MATTPENRVKAKIKKYLKDQRIYHFSAAAGPFSVHGVPDIIACVRGHLLGIEVKAPGKTSNVTENQKYHLQKIKDSGGYSLVADSVEPVIDMVERIRHNVSIR